MIANEDNEDWNKVAKTYYLHGLRTIGIRSRMKLFKIEYLIYIIALVADGFVKDQDERANFLRFCFLMIMIVMILDW